MTKVPSSKPKRNDASSDDDAPQLRQSFEPAERLADLAASVAESLRSPKFDAEHRAVWERRVVAALEALNGATDDQGKRRMVREVLEIVGRDLYDDGEGGTLDDKAKASREAKRVKNVISGVQDADHELGAQLAAIDPALIVDALRAFARGTGRRRREDTGPSPREALAPIYRAIGLYADQGRLNRRAPNELPK